MDDVVYINGVKYVRADASGDEHQDNKCKWWKYGNVWTCAHGRTSMTHPMGYCDQGCCR
jgi:hypothetical protein